LLEIRKQEFYMSIKQSIMGFIAIVTLGAAALPQKAAHAGQGFIPRLVNTTTIPSNGDVNPYGVAFVPQNFPGPLLAPGDVLVSNFNASSNLQGTGTTLVQFSPAGPIAAPGSATVFFTSQLPGLSTALGAMQAGFVLVGNVPTTNGKYDTIGQGAVQVIDHNGNLVATWTDPVFLDGPWDLTIDDHGSWANVFVSNVLNGSVARLYVAVESHTLSVQSKTTIASGYTHKGNAAALVVGPTGLAYDAYSDTLYVASTADNAIYGVPQAGSRTNAAYRGTEIFSSAPLRGPLALRFAPNGDLLAANGDAVLSDPLHPSEIVEITTSGKFVSQYNVDASQGGAFGIDTILTGGKFNYAVIDDVTNSLSVYQLPAP
jgi:hypothetical protein